VLPRRRTTAASRPLWRLGCLTLRPWDIRGWWVRTGSGKSTLGQIIVGLLARDGGAVDRPRHFGHCRNFHWYGTRSRSLSTSGCSQAYRLDPVAARASRDELLEELRLVKYAGYRVEALSGGTRQKLNLSLALLHDPQLPLLDEPYSGLDWETYLRFWEMVERRREQGGDPDPSVTCSPSGSVSRGFMSCATVGLRSHDSHRRVDARAAPGITKPIEGPRPHLRLFWRRQQTIGCGNSRGASSLRSAHRGRCSWKIAAGRALDTGYVGVEQLLARIVAQPADRLRDTESRGDRVGERGRAHLKCSASDQRHDAAEAERRTQWQCRPSVPAGYRGRRIGGFHR